MDVPGQPLPFPGRRLQLDRPLQPLLGGHRQPGHVPDRAPRRAAAGSPRSARTGRSGSRVARSVPPISSAATVPRRRPPETAQASTGPASQATARVGTPAASAGPADHPGVTARISQDHAEVGQRAAASPGGPGRRTPYRGHAGPGRPSAAAPPPAATGWAYRSASRSDQHADVRQGGEPEDRDGPPERDLETTRRRTTARRVTMPQPARRTPAGPARVRSRTTLTYGGKAAKDSDDRCRDGAMTNAELPHTAYGCAHRTFPSDRRGLRPGTGDRAATLGHLLRARGRADRSAARRLRAGRQRADHQRRPARRRSGLAAALARAGQLVCEVSDHGHRHRASSGSTTAAGRPRTPPAAGGSGWPAS